MTYKLFPLMTLCPLSGFSPYILLTLAPTAWNSPLQRMLLALSEPPWSLIMESWFDASSICCKYWHAIPTYNKVL
jgi:hypothetical protein